MVYNDGANSHMACHCYDTGVYPAAAQFNSIVGKVTGIEVRPEVRGMPRTLSHHLTRANACIPFPAYR